jgi:hypothetical protein
VWLLAFRCSALTHSRQPYGAESAITILIAAGSKDNLGKKPAVWAATVFLLDYLLNVTVGIFAGIGAVFSAVPSLQSAAARRICKRLHRHDGGGSHEQRVPLSSNRLLPMRDVH